MTVRRVLVVDDNRDLAVSLAEALSGENFAVSVAVTGEEALRQADQREFDFALVDIKLPGINGVEVLRHLKSRNPDLSTIMMTGATEPALVNQALKDGASEVLRKPFRVEDLIERIRTLVPGHFVLIADDDNEFASAIRDVLDDAGYRVAYVENGVDAVERVHDGTVDVLLLDLRLPGLRGADVVRALERLGHNPAVIVVTAYADEEAEQLEALHTMSVDQCLNKPFDAGSLLKAVDHALCRGSAHRPHPG